MRAPTATLGEILATRAQRTPDRLAFTYSNDGVTPPARLTYLDLHRRAQQVAGGLLDAVAPGSHVLLLLEPGLDFVAAVFGCLQAGMVGVSAMPPHPKRLHRIEPRLRAVAADADVHAVLSTAAIRAAAMPLFADGLVLAGTRWIAVDDAQENMARGVTVSRPSDLAFMQYTSGSTSHPRGVMLTHANLLANAEVLSRNMRLSSESRAFCWLPPSHDMGLVAGILQPVYLGYPSALMSPLTVIKRPLRWLEGVSNFRATVSGAPDFAYELAVRRTTPEQRESLDLSCWEVAFNGAEPIRVRTIEAFRDAFAPYGLRRSSVYPCYGLAEATLMVTGPTRRREPTLLAVDAHGLEQGRVQPPSQGSRAVTLVGCGEAADGHEIVIVERKTRRRARADEVGEIWVYGPSVAQGYWRREAASRAVFEARIEGDEVTSRGFLRTGDVGFVRNRELFIVGRVKDVIILNGRNHHAHDLEAIADSSHHRLRPHCSAAFAIESDAGAAAAIVLEVDPGPVEELAGIIHAVRRQVLHDLDVQLGRVALVGLGAVPKTTSGKIQRQRCRSLLDDPRLELLADWRLR
jgi:acyl-CoA synthetase (AMP-forming)/AMP-acid ligase II